MSITLKLSGIENDKWSSYWYKSTHDNYNDYGSNTGLGNHLFQIASCLALAWDNDKQFYCYDIEIWCKTEKINKELSIWRNINTNKIKVDKIVKVSLGYDIKKFKYTPNTKYMGYFQSFKYFDHHRKKFKIFLDQMIMI